MKLFGYYGYYDPSPSPELNRKLLDIERVFEGRRPVQQLLELHRDYQENLWVEV